MNAQVLKWPMLRVGRGAVCAIASLLLLMSCISKPAPLKPNWNGEDGGEGGEVAEDWSGGNGDIGLPERGSGEEGIGPVDVKAEVGADVVDVQSPEDLISDGEPVEDGIVADLTDTVEPPDVAPDTAGQDAEVTVPDVSGPDVQPLAPGPPVVRPMVFLGTSEGGGLSLLPALVAGQAGAVSTGGGLTLSGGMAATNEVE